jgi:hypothetical protein
MTTATGMVSDGGGLVRPVGSLEHWYSALLGKERGILYEDNYLQIGLQSRWVALCSFHRVASNMSRVPLRACPARGKRIADKQTPETSA